MAIDKRIQTFIREKNRLFNIGVRGAKTIANKARVAFMKSYTQIGGTPGAIGDAIWELSQMAELLQEAGVTAHLYGRNRSIQTAKGHIEFIALGPYDDAQNFMQSRLKISDSRLALLRAKYGQYAIDVTAGMTEHVETILVQAAAEVTEQGMHVREGVSHFRQAFDRAGVSPQHPFLLETLVRTQIAVAYGAGRWNANADPLTQSFLWGYDYVTVGDNRVRDSHEALDGVSLPKDDPAWGDIWPPNGFNCVPGDTVIKTMRGDIPIVDVVKGDMVLTHKKNWKPVLGLHCNKGPDELVLIELENGLNLRLTDNHRIYTERGWVEASRIKIGDKAFNIISPVSDGVICDIDNVANCLSLTQNGSMPNDRIPAPVFGNLENNTESRDIKIDPILADSIIKNKINSYLPKHVGKKIFAFSSFCFCVRMARRIFAMSPYGCLRHFVSNFRSSCGSFSFKHLCCISGSFRVQSVVKNMRLRLRAFCDAVCFKYPAYSSTSNPCFSGYVGNEYLAVPITCDGGIKSARPKSTDSGFGPNAISIAPVGLFSHSGIIVDVICSEVKRKDKIFFGNQNVYNLSVAGDESYFANGIAVHNCRCDVVEVWNDQKHSVKDVPPPEEIDGKTVVPGADEGWRNNTGLIFQDNLGSII